MTCDGDAIIEGSNCGRSPFVIGLTGPIASGKSTVADILRQRGAEVIDADRVYRSLLVPGSELWLRVVERFGTEIVRSDGEIDRAKLAEKVFSDPQALANLDRVTHPAVVAEIRSRIARSHAPIIVVEAVKLVQSGLASDVDALWFVTADPETRLRRLMTRSGMDEPSARARIAAAPATVPESVLVDATIDKSGDLASTSAAVNEAWRAVRSCSAQENHTRVISTQKERS